MSYLERLDSYKEEMLETLAESVSNPSVNSDAVQTEDGEVLPFGKGVYDALKHMLAKGEELGFIGCMILMLILFGIIIKVIMNASLATENEGKFICSGVFASLASQTVINIGMVLGFFPVIGITLPLFSSGGTSALSALICIGLVQSVRGHRMDDMEKAQIRRESQSRIRL